MQRATRQNKHAKCKIKLQYPGQHIVTVLLTFPSGGAEDEERRTDYLVAQSHCSSDSKGLSNLKVDTLAQGFYWTKWFFGEREGNQTGYLIEITDIRETRQAHPIARAQYRFKLENTYINELHILFSSIRKTFVTMTQCAVFLHHCWKRRLRITEKKMTVLCLMPYFCAGGSIVGKYIHLHQKNQ